MSVMILEQSLSPARGSYTIQYIEVVKLRELGENQFLVSNTIVVKRQFMITIAISAVNWKMKTDTIV
jgi:hypothetical protein